MLSGERGDTVAEKGITPPLVLFPPSPFPLGTLVACSAAVAKSNFRSVRWVYANGAGWPRRIS